MRNVHGAMSDLQTRRVYEFSQTSGGNVIVRRNFLRMFDLCKIVNMPVYQAMNEVNPVNLCYYEPSKSFFQPQNNW